MIVRPFTAGCLALVLTAARAVPSCAQDLSALPWRAIGPAAFGGRIDDIEAVPGEPGIDLRRHGVRRRFPQR